MRYQVRHTTHYRYAAPVSHCQSETRLTPRSLPWQTVLERAIVVTPAPASIDERKDYFGNTVTTFSILEHHDRFTTVSTSVVDVEPRGALAEAEAPWDRVRDDLTDSRTPEILEAYEYVFDSPYVAAGTELADYARSTFAPSRPLLEAAAELSHRIFTEFTYQPKATAIDTPLLDTLRLKRGVCQDFSHVMIGALRSLGLAARYVSGYLRSGADYQGAEASHAWVSVFVPGGGWVDFDPTNDVMPGVGHVTLAWGRDYGDVAPIKGIALGGGEQTVEVSVRVEPVTSGIPAAAHAPGR